MSMYDGAFGRRAAFHRHPHAHDRRPVLKLFSNRTLAVYM